MPVFSFRRYARDAAAGGFNSRQRSCKGVASILGAAGRRSSGFCPCFNPLRISRMRKRWRRRSSTRSPSHSWCLTSGFVCWPPAAPSTRHSRSTPHRRKVRCSTPLATVSGTFPRFACFWRRSFPRRPPWTVSRSSMISRGSAAAPCCLTPARCFTTTVRPSPSFLPSMTSPPAVSSSAKRKSCCAAPRICSGRRTCCCAKWSTGLPTACRSSPASCC